jgi:hypothetical protein
MILKQNNIFEIGDTILVRLPNGDLRPVEVQLEVSPIKRRYKRTEGGTLNRKLNQYLRAASTGKWSNGAEVDVQAMRDAAYQILQGDMKFSTSAKNRELMKRIGISVQARYSHE